MWGSRRRADRAAAGRAGADGGLPEESWFNTLLSSDEAAPAGGGRWAESVLHPLAGHALRRIFGTYVAARAALGIALVLGK